MKVLFKETNKRCSFTFRILGQPVYSFTEDEFLMYLYKTPVRHYLQRLESEASHTYAFFLSNAFDVSVAHGGRRVALRGTDKARLTHNPVLILALCDLLLENVNENSLR